MKIKQQKQLNLPQLIEWAWNNDIRNRHIRADQDISSVVINMFGDIHITDEVKRDYTFTVEVEEEITEDTVLPKLLIILKSNPLIFQDDNGKQRAFTYKSTSIKSMLNKAQSQKDNVDTIHIVNDDGTHTLIWTHDKGLVE